MKTLQQLKASKVSGLMRKLLNYGVLCASNASLPLNYKNEKEKLVVEIQKEEDEFEQIFIDLMKGKMK